MLYGLFIRIATPLAFFAMHCWDIVVSTASGHRDRPLTYINDWTELSSNDSSAEVQGAAVAYYVPSWAAP